MQNNGETRQTARDLLQNVETKLGLRAGLKLVSAVRSANGDGQRVNASAMDKLLHLIGIGVAGMLLRNHNIIFDTSQCAELSLDDNTVSVSIPTTWRVMATFSSKGLEDASIITEVKPFSMHSLQTSKESP